MCCLNYYLSSLTRSSSEKIFLGLVQKIGPNLITLSKVPPNPNQLNYVIALSLEQLPLLVTLNEHWKLIIFEQMLIAFMYSMVNYLYDRIFIFWGRRCFISYSEIPLKGGCLPKRFTGSWGVSCPKNSSRKVSKKFWVSRNARGGVVSKLLSPKMDIDANLKENNITEWNKIGRNFLVPSCHLVGKLSRLFSLKRLM